MEGCENRGHGGLVRMLSWHNLCNSHACYQRSSCGSRFGRGAGICRCCQFREPNNGGTDSAGGRHPACPRGLKWQGDNRELNGVAVAEAALGGGTPSTPRTGGQRCGGALGPKRAKN